MGIKDSLKYHILGVSIKEMQMGKILNKISKKVKLTENEKRFLDLYNYTSIKENKDYMMISKNTAFKKIKSLIKTLSWCIDDGDKDQSYSLIEI